MQISPHGHIRIRERTRLAPDEVLSILERELTIELGSSGPFDYLLFHSPPDGKAKIAVIRHGENGPVLESIWEASFGLPAAVRVPTREERLELKAAYLRDFFKKNNAEHGAHLFSMQIQVELDGNIEFTLEACTLARRQIPLYNTMHGWDLVATQLQPILDIVDTYPRASHVEYRILYRSLATGATLYTESVRHKRIKQRLEAAFS